MIEILKMKNLLTVCIILSQQGPASVFAPSEYPYRQVIVNSEFRDA